ncbi:glycosyltransferase family 2 protein [Streptomyces sp. NPDC094468]|uniref:glycosyltransferase family 2 protein n=1 Tax=Streptomyces sp. NPDC094468 TaxID=3366066 RepID=UPI0037F7739C
MTSPLFGVITAMGRPEYDLLILAAHSLVELEDVARGFRRGIEWVVVLDGMEDTGDDHAALVQEVARFAGISVTVLRNAGPPGPGPARNVGLARVSAPWLITLDSDDTIRPEGMCALLRSIEETPGAAWAAGRCPHTDREGHRIWDGPADYFAPGPIEVTASFWEAKLLLGGLPFLCTATLASARAVRSVGGWPEDRRRRAEDTCLWAVLTSRFRGVWVPEDVYLYRRHEKSVTHQPGFRQIDERLADIEAMIAAGTTRLLAD